MRESWRLLVDRFDARVLQFKGDPAGWVLVILDKDTGFIRDGFETLVAEGLVFDGGYNTADAGKREAERILKGQGVKIENPNWIKVLHQ